MNTAPGTFSLSLGLPKKPSLSVEASTLEHGQARYAVHGPNVRGTFIVVPVSSYGQPLNSRAVTVHFGDGTERVRTSVARPDEPVVNGVRIHGATEVIDPRRLRSQPHFLGSRATVLLHDGATRRIPDGARAVTQAVVTALVRHWYQRPDRDELVRAATRHRAADHLAHEKRAIARLETEITAVRAERAQAGLRSRQLGGLIRRRQPPLAAPDTRPVDVPLSTRKGAPLGTVTVRELEVSVRPGRVVYEISGPRIRTGLLTMGPNIYDRTPIPQGFYACWGRPVVPNPFTRERTGMPSINRVVMHGGWSHSGATDARTSDTPVRGQGPTAERAAAILRAVAARFLARPDLNALRIAAGKRDAARGRASAHQDLDRLRAKEARLKRRLHHHQARTDHFAALLPAPDSSSPAHRIHHDEGTHRMSELQKRLEGLALGDHVSVTGVDTRGHNVTRTGKLLADVKQVNAQRNGFRAKGWRLSVGPDGTDPAKRSTWVTLFPDSGTVDTVSPNAGTDAADGLSPDARPDSNWSMTELRLVPGVGANYRNIRFVFGGRGGARSPQPTGSVAVTVVYTGDSIYDLWDPATGTVHLSCRLSTRIWWAPIPKADGPQDA